MQFIPYLSFDGRCEEAFEHYHACLGGEIVAMLRYSEMPNSEETDAATRDKIAHARLVVGDAVLMASDAPPQFQAKPQGFEVAIQVDDPAEAERIFEALGKGGNVTMPLQETFWAKKFGMFVDRFGVPWMVNCEKPS